MLRPRTAFEFARNHFLLLLVAANALALLKCGKSHHAHAALAIVCRRTQMPSVAGTHHAPAWTACLRAQEGDTRRVGAARQRHGNGPASALQVDHLR